MYARVRQAPILGEVDRSGGVPASELVGIIGDRCLAVRSAIGALAAEEPLDTKARRMVTQQARQLIIAQPVCDGENCRPGTVKSS